MDVGIARLGRRSAQQRFQRLVDLSFSELDTAQETERIAVVGPARQHQPDSKLSLCNPAGIEMLKGGLQRGLRRASTDCAG